MAFYVTFASCRNRESEYSSSDEVLHHSSTSKERKDEEEDETEDLGWMIELKEIQVLRLIDITISLFSNTSFLCVITGENRKRN